MPEMLQPWILSSIVLNWTKWWCKRMKLSWFSCVGVCCSDLSSRSFVGLSENGSSYRRENDVMQPFLSPSFSWTKQKNTQIMLLALLSPCIPLLPWLILSPKSHYLPVVWAGHSVAEEATLGEFLFGCPRNWGNYPLGMFNSMEFNVFCARLLRI